MLYYFYIVLFQKSCLDGKKYTQNRRIRVNGGTRNHVKWKKLAATVVAAAAAVSCVGCGNQALAYPLTIDGVKIKAGIYIYYSYQAYTEATSTIQKQNSDLDTTDEEVVKAQTIDGKDAETWIKDRTMEYCKEFVAIQKDFDAKGLELSIRNRPIR